MIGHLALSRIELDLDDGVKVNYEKIQTASDGKKYPVWQNLSAGSLPHRSRRDNTEWQK